MWGLANPQGPGQSCPKSWGLLWEGLALGDDFTPQIKGW